VWFIAIFINILIAIPDRARLIHPEPKGVYDPSPACNSSHQQTLLFGDYLFGSEEYLRRFRPAHPKKPALIKSKRWFYFETKKT